MEENVTYSGIYLNENEEGLITEFLKEKIINIMCLWDV